MNRVLPTLILLATLAAVPRAEIGLDSLVASDGSRAGLWIPAPPKGSSRKLPLVVWLHGGLGANNPAKGVAAARNMAATWSASGAFALLAPSAWPASPWWSPGAAARILELVEQAARRPGIDATRIVVAGVFDGGSGALWTASRLRPQWGGKLKAIAVWSTLPDVMIVQGASWDPAPLKGLPLRWTVGDKDHLYPVERVRPWWEPLRTAGVILEVHENPTADHDLSFHGADLAAFPAWVRAKAR